MIFKETLLAGVWVVGMEPDHDGRGFFARSWCRDEFTRRGLAADFVQGSVSFNHRAHTLRGLHWQAAPHGEAKLVRCTRGRLFDVAVDVRPGSPTFAEWYAIELDADNRLALYIPEGVAHGFQTLEDATEVLYQISGYHHPESFRGIRWDDPRVAVAWPPAEGRIVSERDRTLPTLAEDAC